MYLEERLGEVSPSLLMFTEYHSLAATVMMWYPAKGEPAGYPQAKVASMFA